MLFLAVVKEQSFCSYCLDQNLVYQSLSWELSIETKIQPLQKLCLHLKQLVDMKYRISFNMHGIIRYHSILQRSLNKINNNLYSR